jgi:hypothetical protein
MNRSSSVICSLTIANQLRTHKVHPSVIILGGGIGGLTAAHVLINRGYNVTLFERNDVCGGLARSRESINKECPCEYSWRVFGSYYINLLNILQQIPYENKTVFENLVPIKKGKPTGCPNITPLGLDFEKIPIKDKITLLQILLKGSLSCDARNIEELSHLNWSEYLKSKNISDITYKYAVRPLGPVLGFENNKASVYDVVNAAEILFESSYLRMDSKYSEAYITNGPTNTKWFDPWVTCLKKNGVKLYTSATVNSINMKNGLIHSVIVSRNNRQIRYTADYFICALSLESILDLAKNTDLWKYEQIRNLEPLYKYGRQLQLSMQFYFSKRAYFHRQYSVSYLPDCPWGIIIEPEGTVWADSFDIKKYCGSDIKDIWSVGVCEPDVNGLLVKKPFRYCTPSEIATEVWYQIQHQPNFKEHVCVEDGSKFSDLKPIDYKIWHSFEYKNGVMDTWEPKFANNTNTKKFRPKIKTQIPNFFFSTAYCDTAVGIHCMEGAAEAGIEAANEIIISSKWNPEELHKKRRLLPIVFGIPRTIDNILYRLNLPHWLTYLFIIVGVYIIKKMISDT